MDKQIAVAILQFMERVNLVGKETPAFVACVNELQRIVNEKKPDGEPGVST